MTDEHRPVDDDLYSTLGVPTGATDDEITRAYRRLARRHHPDANQDCDTGAFADITDAYDTLRDPDRRRAYDDTHRRQPWESPSGVRIPIRDITGDRGGRPGPRTNTSSQTAGPTEIELPLSFEQAALGTTVVVPVRMTGACSDCNGAGTERRPPAPCPSCTGSGTAARTSSGITIRTQCMTCGGTGRQPPAPCRRCAGSRTSTVERNVTITVPAGTEPGARLRGHVPDEPGLEMVAVARVAPHRWFDRRGNDLVVRCPITLAEAALGAVVSVPTLDGNVAIRVPPGTPHGRILRVRCRGLTVAGRIGDLLARVEITVPTELNDAQRAALEAFAAATDPPRPHDTRP